MVSIKIINQKALQPNPAFAFSSGIIWPPCRRLRKSWSLLGSLFWWDILSIPPSAWAGFVARFVWSSGGARLAGPLWETLGKKRYGLLRIMPALSSLPEWPTVCPVPKLLPRASIVRSVSFQGQAGRPPGTKIERGRRCPQRQLPILERAPTTLKGILRELFMPPWRHQW